ncbi:MAG: hypothetical protein KBT36_13905 [Kurthia sp.]|nr:hypothetical protein [Candidatus Kurthia equi]
MLFNGVLLAADALLDKIKSGNPGTVDNNTHEIVTDSGSLTDTIAGLKGASSTLIVDFVDWGSIVIAILFVIGVVMMLVSIMFRNGQWQKWGQGTMLMAFLALLAIRAFPIVILSFKSGTDINDALTDGLAVFSQIALFLCVVGILLSILFRFAYALIKHPEYHRWSKNVLNVSIMMIFVALIAPYIFKF